MTNETTDSQPKSIGDDAQFGKLLQNLIARAGDFEGGVNIHGFVSALTGLHEYVDHLLNSRAPAAQASATIQEPVMVAEPVAHELMQQLGTMRAVFHTNMLRAYPEKSHAEITVEIDRALGAAPMVADPAGVAVDMRNVISNAIYGYGAMLEDHTGTVDAIAKALAATVKAVPSEALEHAQQMQGARGIISTLSLSLEAFMTAYDEGDAPDSEQEAALQAAATDAYKWLITDVKACMVRDKLIRDAAPPADKTGGGE